MELLKWQCSISIKQKIVKTNDTIFIPGLLSCVERIEEQTVVLLHAIETEFHFSRAGGLTDHFFLYVPSSKAVQTQFAAKVGYATVRQSVRSEMNRRKTIYLRPFGARVPFKRIY